jgi:hypothetical protein
MNKHNLELHLPVCPKSRRPVAAAQAADKAAPAFKKAWALLASRRAAACGSVTAQSSVVTLAPPPTLGTSVLAVSTGATNLEAGPSSHNQTGDGQLDQVLMPAPLPVQSRGTEGLPVLALDPAGPEVEPTADTAGSIEEPWRRVMFDLHCLVQSQYNPADALVSVLEGTRTGPPGTEVRLQ